MEVPKKVVLDTTVMIRHLRGKEPRLMSELESRAEPATTIINVFELYHGAHKSREVRRNLSAVKGFLSTLEVLTMDDASAERSGEVLAKLEREGRAIDPRDLFIGCVAIENGYAIVTDNREHFERIPELLVLAPSEFG
ncbi:MAG: type II toxin-antitoxin system VapC family toxin [Nitrososphaerales archaeon]|nr:type II toxin-antitoxin system VapC family toxin [Nitrososphaerales archaeon]